MTIRTQFVEAARLFADQVEAVPETAWDGPGLGPWNLRALVGHTSRSLITVETYLRRPAPTAELASPVAYYLRVADQLAADDRDAILQRGRAAGQVLGENPATVVTDLVRRVVSVVETEGDPLLTSIVGGIALTDYLPTRTFELVVHGLDIAAALGTEPPRWSEPVTTAVASLAAAIAVGRGSGRVVIEALTGRGRLPDGFSVV